ncbi:MAG TPA: AtzH-like domain-containing protein [Blastocatellia bacterium]|nr:AtzH-like domain-containing protein [Blastocatellia bacterium]
MRARLFVLAVVTGASIIATPSNARSQVKTDTGRVEAEVRKAFDTWTAALTQGDKRTYLDGFWDSPRLVIRVASGEWRGFDAYRKRIEAAQLPPGNPAAYRNVEVVALGTDGAVVTYERPAPAQTATVGASGAPSIVFRGTAVFIRAAGGWKVAAWHADSVTK